MLQFSSCRLVPRLKSSLSILYPIYIPLPRTDLGGGGKAQRCLMYPINNPMQPIGYKTENVIETLFFFSSVFLGRVKGLTLLIINRFGRSVLLFFYRSFVSMLMPPLLLLGLPLTLDVLGIVTGLAAMHGSQNGYASRSNTPTPFHATVCAWKTTKYLYSNVGTWYQVLGICFAVVV